MLSDIQSCNGCVPPKRHIGCHSTCKEYLDEKAEYDMRLAEQNLKRNNYHMNTNGTQWTTKQKRGKRKHNPNGF